MSAPREGGERSPDDKRPPRFGRDVWVRVATKHGNERGGWRHADQLAQAISSDDAPQPVLLDGQLLFLLRVLDGNSWSTRPRIYRAVYTVWVEAEGRKFEVEVLERRQRTYLVADSELRVSDARTLESVVDSGSVPVEAFSPSSGSLIDLRERRAGPNETRREIVREAKERGLL